MRYGRGDHRLGIGELSARTGASHRSLRHYEALGLLPAERASNGYRYFGEEAVELVQRIKALLALGLPLRSVREVLSCVRTKELHVVAGCQQLRDTLDDELRRLDAVEARVQETRRAITAVLRRRSSSVMGPACPTKGEWA